MEIDIVCRKASRFDTVTLSKQRFSLCLFCSYEIGNHSTFKSKLPVYQFILPSSEFEIGFVWQNKCLTRQIQRVLKIFFQNCVGWPRPVFGHIKGSSASYDSWSPYSESGEKTDSDDHIILREGCRMEFFELIFKFVCFFFEKIIPF